MLEFGINVWGSEGSIMNFRSCEKLSANENNFLRAKMKRSYDLQSLYMFVFEAE